MGVTLNLVAAMATCKTNRRMNWCLTVIVSMTFVIPVLTAAIAKVLKITKRAKVSHTQNTVALQYGFEHVFHGKSR